jgi:hypothetical protein
MTEYKDLTYSTPFGVELRIYKDSIVTLEVYNEIQDLKDKISSLESKISLLELEEDDYDYDYDYELDDYDYEVRNK